MENFDIHNYFDAYEGDGLSCFVPNDASVECGIVQEDFNVVIIGVPSVENEMESVQRINSVRRYLYQLSNRFQKVRLCDLGNLKSEALSVPQMLSDVLSQLAERKVVTILLSGGDNLSVACDALSDISPEQEISIIDSCLGLMGGENGLSGRGALLDVPFVSSVSFIGYQNYYSTMEEEALLSDKGFEHIRLRDLTGKVYMSEPCLRDSHLVQFNLSAIRYSDAPLKCIIPNGLTGVDACQIGHYAGLSDRTLCYELSRLDEISEADMLTPALVAQLVWHIIEGVDNRYGDYPLRSIEDYQQYVVLPKVEGDQKIVFYHNRANGRWWVEIPTCKGNCIYSCKQKDYLDFCNNQIPDIWMKYYMK